MNFFIHFVARKEFYAYLCNMKRGGKKINNNNIINI